MCDSCTLPHRGGSRPAWRALVAPAIVLFGVVAAVAALLLSEDPTPAAVGRTDAVFERDAAAHAREGLALADAVARAAMRPELREFAAEYASYEQSLSRGLTRGGRAVSGASAAGVAALSAGESDRAAVSALLDHSRQDIVLARIELSDGRSAELRTRAATMLRTERRNVERLRRLDAGG
jgi:hypothetical protein